MAYASVVFLVVCTSHVSLGQAHLKMINNRTCIGVEQGGVALAEAGSADHQVHSSEPSRASQHEHLSHSDRQAVASAAVPPLAVSVNLNINIGIGDAADDLSLSSVEKLLPAHGDATDDLSLSSVKKLLPAHGDAADDLSLSSVERLLPARMKHEQSFQSYAGEGIKIEYTGLHQVMQMDIANLVGSEKDALGLIREADHNGDNFLDAVEYGLLLDLICWHLKIEIKGPDGHHFECEVTGEGALLLASVEGITLAHADLDASFKCFDKDRNGKITGGELEALKLSFDGLGVPSGMLDNALDESKWGTAGYGELQFDYLLMRLCSEEEHHNANIGIH